MRYERVKVKRDTNTVHNHAVAPWEIPVLEFIFEEGNVERTEAFTESGREYPEPAVELDRLVRAYGSDPQTGIPYVNSVFGNARAGVAQLRKLIDAAKEEDEAAALETKPTPAKSKKARRPAEADSLLS